MGLVLGTALAWEEAPAGTAPGTDTRCEATSMSERGSRWI